MASRPDRYNHAGNSHRKNGRSHWSSGRVYYIKKEENRPRPSEEEEFLRKPKEEEFRQKPENRESAPVSKPARKERSSPKPKETKSPEETAISALSFDEIESGTKSKGKKSFVKQKKEENVPKHREMEFVAKPKPKEKDAHLEECEKEEGGRERREKSAQNYKRKRTRSASSSRRSSNGLGSLHFDPKRSLRCFEKHQKSKEGLHMSAFIAKENETSSRGEEFKERNDQEKHEGNSKRNCKVGNNESIYIKKETCESSSDEEGRRKKEERKEEFSEISDLNIQREVTNEIMASAQEKFEREFLKAQEENFKKTDEWHSKVQKLSNKTHFTSSSLAKLDTYRGRIADFKKISELMEKRLKGLVGLFEENPSEGSEMKIIQEIKRFRYFLPTYAYYEEILESIERHQFSLITGGTGSGKSTQIPQYMHDKYIWMRKEKKKIICSQPRKIAAKSLACRVSEEMFAKVSDKRIQFLPGLWRGMDPEAEIVFTTDRILLDFLLENRSLEGIAALFIDEAHERSIHSDLLLGLLKKMAPKRPDVKIIVCSATIEKEEFTNFYPQMGFFEIPGRTYPIQTFYLEKSKEEEPKLKSQESWREKFKQIERIIVDYVKKHLKKQEQSPESHSKLGDILVFLAEVSEIMALQKHLGASLGEWTQKESTCSKKQIPTFEILLLYSGVSWNEQQMVLEPLPQSQKNRIKVVLATNIAQTSVTIDGVRLVIDLGTEKDVQYDPIRKMNMKEVRNISKSSAEQRKGRCGRTAPGICWRLYTKSAYDSFSPNKPPEILRVSLDQVVLKLKQLGVRDIEEFEFVSSPSMDQLREASDLLTMLGGIDKDTQEITDHGIIMANLLTSPSVSRMVIESIHKGILQEGLLMGSILENSRGFFTRVKAKGGEMYEMKTRVEMMKAEHFYHSYGDPFSMFQVIQTVKKMKSFGEMKKWCIANYVNFSMIDRIWKTVDENKKSLVRIPELKRKKMSLSDELKDLNEIKEDLVKCILAGFFPSLSKYTGNPEIGYTSAISASRFHLNMESVYSISQAFPQEWIVFVDLIEAQSHKLEGNLVRKEAFMITAIKEELIDQVVPLKWQEELGITRLKGAEKYRCFTFKFIPTLYLEGISQRQYKFPELSHLRDKINLNIQKGELRLWTENANEDYEYLKLALKKSEELSSTICYEIPFLSSTRLLIDCSGRLKRILFQNEFINVLVTGFDRRVDTEKLLEEILAIKLPKEKQRNSKSKEEESEMSEYEEEEKKENSESGQSEKENDRFIAKNGSCASRNKDTSSSFEGPESIKNVRAVFSFKWKEEPSLILTFPTVEKATGFVKQTEKGLLFGEKRLYVVPFYHSTLNYAENYVLCLEWYESEANGIVEVSFEKEHECTSFLSFIGQAEGIEKFECQKSGKTLIFKERGRLNWSREDWEKAIQRVLSFTHQIMKPSIAIGRFETSNKMKAEELLRKLEVLLIETAAKMNVDIGGPPQIEISFRDNSHYSGQVNATVRFAKTWRIAEISGALNGQRGLIGVERLLSHYTCELSFTISKKKMNFIRNDLESSLHEIKLQLMRQNKEEFVYEQKEINNFLTKHIIKTKTLQAIRLAQKQLDRVFEGETVELTHEEMQRMMKGHFKKQRQTIERECKVKFELVQGLNLWKVMGENKQLAKSLLNRLLHKTSKEEWIWRTFPLIGKNLRKLFIKGPNDFRSIKRKYAEEADLELRICCVNKHMRIRSTLASFVKIEGFLEKLLEQKEKPPQNESTRKEAKCEKPKLKWNESPSETDELEEELDEDLVECKICLEPIINRYKLAFCREEFCRECLVQHFKEKIDSQEQINCPSCFENVHYADVLSFFPPNQMKKLLKKQVDSFVTANSDSFGVCPTPDCGQIFNKRNFSFKMPSVFSCDNCGKNTTIESRDWAELKKIGVKQCPSCMRPIIKSEGCNHVTCTCGTHICYKCGKGFDTSKKCYEHMRKEHNGIYDDPELNRDLEMLDDFGQEDEEDNENNNWT